MPEPFTPFMGFPVAHASATHGAMNVSLRAGGLLPLVLLTACSATPPAGNPAPDGTAQPAVPTASAAPTAVVPPDANGVGTISMYPVQRIYSLFDLQATAGTIELRLGTDPGGGAVGQFRYVPLVNGAPVVEQETEPVEYVNTASYGFLELVGKRPGLMMHTVTGFRSAGSDNYQLLGADNRWSTTDGYGEPGYGTGILPWSNDRLLEWRRLRPNDDDMSAPDATLPWMRVFRGTDKQAPKLPKALVGRLVKAGFTLETFFALPTGEVLSVGKLAEAKGFGTLVWKEDLKQPQYFVTEGEAFADPQEITFLGGDTLARVRLQVDRQVMKLDGSAWVVESTIGKDGLPDVWLGAPMVRQTAAGAFARLAEGAPWRPIQVKGDPEKVEQRVAIDAEGVIWKLEDDLLLSSRKPAAQLPDVTEEDLVKARKASILRGGSDDFTGAPPGNPMTGKCSMHYVLLDEAPEKAADDKDYPRHRAALKGHPEIAKARFIVTVEKGGVFFGALVRDYDTAASIRKAVADGVKGSSPSTLCAEPPAKREIKIDPATGNVVK